MDANARCKALVKATADLLAWEADGRFGCVVAAFEVANADAIRDALSRALEYTWTSDSAASAPPRVQAIADRLGLRPGQLLFTSDPTERAIVFGAWWPWGDGERVSVRVGLDGVDDDISDWFGRPG